MNRNLILSAFMLLGLASCQKESTNVKSAIAPNLSAGIMKPVVGQLPDVVIMNLVGPNTYEGYFHGSGIKLTGPVYYDQVKYPTVVDGIPVVMADLSTYDGASIIRSVNTGTEGNVFSTWVPILGGLPSTGFDTDFDAYMSAWSNWTSMGATGTPPLLGGYLHTSYSQVGHSITFTGKVIKVTTGSGVALTEINYPIPTAQPSPPNNQPLWWVADTQLSNTSYNWTGKNGNIISATEKVNGTTIGPVQVTGAYTYNSSTGIMHHWGTIVRPNGTTFTWNITENIQ